MERLPLLIRRDGSFRVGPPEARDFPYYIEEWMEPTLVKADSRDIEPIVNIQSRRYSRIGRAGPYVVYEEID